MSKRRMESESRCYYRYSESFKQQVVNEFESGQWTQNELRHRYGIRGSNTLSIWLRKYGKNHLLCRQVRIETMEERSLLEKERAEVKKLKELIIQIELERMKSEQYLNLACKELGVEVESFKKKRLCNDSPRD